MRFLIDNNLSPTLADLLNQAGHDAVHIRSYQLGAASDTVVLGRARREHRVLISADTDFGTLLAHERAGDPSVILLRRSVGRRAKEIASLLLANLDAVREDLDSGAVVVVGDRGMRVRQLPL